MHEPTDSCMITWTEESLKSYARRSQYVISKILSHIVTSIPALGANGAEMERFSWVPSLVCSCQCLVA